MRRATGLGAGLVIGLGVLVGCGQEKQLPSDVQIPTAKEGPQAASVPTKSQPEAIRLVERCLKAATDGHPERLERAKALTQSAKGTFRWSSGQVVPATRHFQAVWPARARVTLDYLTGDVKQFQLGFRRPDFWAFNVRDAGPQDFNPPDAKEYAEIVAVDLVALYWLPMLVPLVDPGTVMFGAKKETLEGQPAEVIQISVPGCPVFSFWIDEKTSLPRLIAFTHTEAGTTYRKHLVLSDHKAFAGVLVPTASGYSRNDVPVEQWTITACDFVDKIDDATFDRPAEKK